MNTGIDLNYVQQTYQKMSDDELVRTATQDAHGLTPCAMEIVINEIKKRGLDETIVKGVEAQNKTYTIEEVDKYCDIVCKLSCPSCGSTTERLNATTTGEVMSFIFFTTYKKKIKIGCPHCLDDANNNALTKTAVLGWWGIPWGIINTIQSISLNLKNKRTNHHCTHNDNLRFFVLGKIGELETYKDNKEKLQQIVARQNSL